MAIDIRKFRHVVETARCESVTHAAAILHITQSALTRSIAEVEAELGIQLFVRLPRGVRVTDAGRSFVDRAKRIIGDVDELLTGITDYQKLNTGRLRLGVAPAGYQRFVAQPVARLAGENPSLAIEIIPGSVDELAPRLTAGVLDAIVGHAGMLRLWPDLEVTPVVDFHCAMLLRKDHPLSGKSRISEADILRYPLLLPSSIEPLQNGIATLCVRNGLPPPNPHYVTDDFGLVTALIQATDAFTPAISLNPTFGRLRDNFMLLEREIELPTQRLAFAVSKTRARTPAASAVETSLVDALTTRPDPA